MSIADDVVRTAESMLGCPYVYGAWGQTCTVTLRKRYASLRPAHAGNIYARCQRLRDKNQKSSCDGCQYFGKLAFDCRGFTHYCLKEVDINITGQSVATQYNGKNWAEKGTIESLPDLVCCVFIHSGGKWQHTGLHVGGGNIIHCSGEVKRDTVGGERKWSHYAVPLGLYTEEEIKNARRLKPVNILKRGTSGPAVTELQKMLSDIGYGYIVGNIDGIFGAKTEAAVKAFQQNNGLTADGIAGPITLTLLAARNAVPDQSTAPDDGDKDSAGYVNTDALEDVPEDEAPEAVISDMIQIYRNDLAEIRRHLQNAVALIDGLLTDSVLKG